jgi:hypothetical protein
MFNVGSGAGPILIPSLAAILLITSFTFGVGSQLTPLILLVASTILLLYTYSLHTTQFMNDYKYSTWQDSLRPMAPLVLVGVVLALSYGMYALTTDKMVGGRRFSRR